MKTYRVLAEETVVRSAFVDVTIPDDQDNEFAEEMVPQRLGGYEF